MAKRTKKSFVKDKVHTGFWEIDPEGLEAAKKVLGIEWPVKISRTSSQDHHGVHRGKMKNGIWCHYITVNKYASLKEATKTLLHELQHAIQMEKVYKEKPENMPLAQAWRNNPDRQGKYYNRKIEVEAREASKRWEEFPNLVRWEMK